MIVDDTDLFNVAVVTANGFPPDTDTDARSTTRFLPRLNQRSSFESNPLDVLSHSEYIVGKGKNPVPRVQSVTIDLLTLGQGASVLPYVLGAQFYDLTSINRHPADGSPFTQRAYIDGISDDIQWVPTRLQGHLHLLGDQLMVTRSNPHLTPEKLEQKVQRWLRDIHTGVAPVTGPEPWTFPPIQTGGRIASASFKFIRCNTTAGGFAIALPTTPPNRTVVGVQITTSAPGTR